MKHKMDKPVDSNEAKCLKEAVDKTADVRGYYCEGKGAIKEGKNQIVGDDGIKISGSLNIDDATRPLYPTSNRWDYVVECNESLHFVEVHDANRAGEIETIKAKKRWLYDWLNDHAPSIKKLAGWPPRVHWVATGEINLGRINYNSVQWRRHDIPKPVKLLKLK